LIIICVCESAAAAAAVGATMFIKSKYNALKYNIYLIPLHNSIA
jgi:hypothetical protein